MSGQFESATHQDLFRHVTAESSVLYRCVHDVCAAAERQLLLYVRPSEILAQANWPGDPPTVTELDGALDKRTDRRSRLRRSTRASLRLIQLGQSND